MAFLAPQSMETTLNANLRLQAPGTLEWLFGQEQYKKWKDSEASTLWIHGSPGSGKTILCAAIINQLRQSLYTEDTKTGLAYFFFSATDPESQTTRGFLSSILTQLWKQMDHDEWMASFAHRFPSSLDCSKPCSKQDIFSMILEVLSFFKQVYVVVDALDESDTGERDQLFYYITELRQNEIPGLHLLLASRLNVDIQNSVTALPALLISIEPGNTTGDIRAYVSTTLRNNTRLSHLDADLKKEITEGLVERSHGMFIWVAAILSVLSKGHTSQMTMDTLSSLPVGLNNLYSRMILDIEDHRRDEAFNALRWLSCSLEPLSMSTLAEAAILRLGSSPFLPEDDRFARPRDLLPILNGLATIKKPPAGSDAVEMVFLVHQSLVDFLMSDQIRHTQAHQFAIDEQETERFLAESCIEYILYYSHSKAKQGTVSDFDRFPLLKYACKHWMNHARHWENGRRAAFESGMNDVEGVHIKELILTLLTDSDSLSCWLSVFDPEDPTKKPFTSPRSETTALLYAIRSGSLSTIRKLLESHADIATSNTFGRNPLHVAVEFRQTTIVRELFKTERARGLSGELVLNIALKQDASGRTPVLEAALSGDTALIDVFLQFTDAKRIGAATINGVPFAHYLAQVAESTILEQFLAFLRISGEKLDLKDAAGMTLLHHSVMSGNLSAATVLVKRGADINSQDENKDTPLHFAIRKNQDATRELLINAGADVTLMNSRRTSPLAESWAKKSLDWGSYKVDITKTGRMSHGVQAECHVLRKIEGSRSDGPDFIFRKTYDLSRCDSSAARGIQKALLRENRILRRVDHPFVISYLGFEEIGGDSNILGYVLYLEYCELGDLEMMHVKRVSSPPQMLPDDEEQELFDGMGLPTILENPEPNPLSKSDVWTLMYQLFAALAYLHYGVTILKRGNCRVEPHWDPHIHRDIKPHNVVLKSGPNKERIAKLCDLGTSRTFVNAKYQTRPTDRGTEAYWPPEIRDRLVEEQSKKWTTKGDVYSLGKTIQDLSKNFTPDEEMQGVLDRSQQMFSEERWNSLEILEEIHKHRHQLKEPFTSFEPVLGGKPGGFTYQAFLHISKGLDTPASFDLEHTKSQRQKLVGRLELLLKDGAAEAFRIHSRSLHLAVLLRNKELLQRLLDEGQNPDESWPISGWTALHLATQENRKDLVDALLKAETKANTKDKFGHTPLSYASKGGHSEIERLIRERSRRVQSNAAYEAMQINSPINPFDEHLIIEGNTAYDASLQVNYPIAQDVFRRILEARDVRRQ